MATLWWRAVNGQWSTASNWSTTADGNTPSASVPSSTTDVVFTSYSGRCDLYSGIGSVSCQNLTADASYASYINPSNSWLDLYGSISISTSTQWNGCNLRFRGLAIVNVNMNLPIGTGNNGYIPNLYINSSNKNVTLLSNIKFGTLYIQNAGILNTNGYNLTGTSILLEGSSISSYTTLNVNNNTTINLTDNLGLTQLPFGLVNANTNSTINITGSTGGTCGININPNSIIKNLNITPTVSVSDFRFGLDGSLAPTNTCNITNLTITNNGSVNSIPVFFGQGLTWPITNLTVRGVSGKNTLISSGQGGSIFTINSSGGKIDCDYITLSYCTGSGTSKFYAGSHSTNGGNNTNWLWSDYVAPATFHPLTFGFGHVI